MTNPNRVIKTISVADQQFKVTGNTTDPYFQGIEHHAVGLNGLAAFVQRHVAADATVLDIGANIGLSTMLLARRTGRVIAYEPSGINAEILRLNLALNEIDNVDVVQAAVSARPSVLRFHDAAFGAGSHVVQGDHLISEHITTSEVPSIALDDQSLAAVSFIKLDVEGHEPDVLAGARALLRQDRPLIFMELNMWCLSAFTGYSPGVFIRALWRNFEVFETDLEGNLNEAQDTYGFLHDLIVARHGMADIVIRPRPGLQMPTLPELTWPEAALAIAKAQ